MTVLFSLRDSKANLIHEAVIEAGSPIRIGSFFHKVPDDAKFITDVSSIDTNVPSIYKIKVHYSIVFNETVTLRIEDTVAPQAEGVTKTVLSYDQVPSPAEMVKDAYDLSGISSIEYESVPDFRNGGIINAPVRLTDNYGNSSVVNARFIVGYDTTPPVIHGFKDITINPGESPDLSEGVYATDNVSGNVPVRINISGLNVDTPGSYEISYEAEDNAGNKTTEKVTVTVARKSPPRKKTAKKRVVRYAKPDYSKVDALARQLVKKLKRGSDVETARAIFKWVHKNIHYVHSASKATGKKAAYQGLTKYKGNCRVYAYTCKILLQKAGIPNMIVTRYPVTTHHYWNLVYMNGGWYHCDATPFRNHPKVYFKLTDSELDKYHKFKSSKYPKRATK